MIFIPKFNTFDLPINLLNKWISSCIASSSHQLVSLQL